MYGRSGVPPWPPLPRELCRSRGMRRLCGASPSLSGGVWSMTQCALIYHTTDDYACGAEILSLPAGAYPAALAKACGCQTLYLSLIHI